jgi:hypothetical protein
MIDTEMEMTGQQSLPMINDWRPSRRISRAAMALMPFILLIALAPGASRTPVLAHSAHIVYVAIGDVDTIGSATAPEAAPTQTFPNLLARHLPHGARTLILGDFFGHIANIQQDTLPTALAAHPTLVTVWVGWADLSESTAPADYRASLDAILTALQRQHARVFIGNMLNMRIVPSDYYGGAGLVQPALVYNAIIAALAVKHGAIVVDLYANTALLYPHPELQADAYAFNSRGEAVMAQIFYRTMHAHHAL